jgi:hypothetical protein
MTNPTQIEKITKQKQNPSQLLAALSGLRGLLGEEVLMNVGEDTTLGNSDVAQQLVQFLIVSDGELKVAGDDTSFLVVTSGVSSKLENFSSKILQDGSQIDRCTGTNTLGVVSLAKKTVNTTDRESQAGLGRTRLSVLAAASLATRFASSHFD